MCQVAVYYNRNKKCWSVAAYKSPRSYGRVLQHADTVRIKNATFVVRESSRQWVVRNKCRAVHAWITGELVSVGGRDQKIGTKVSYNPYRAAHFHPVGNVEVKIEEAAVVRFSRDRKVYVTKPQGVK